MNGLLLKLMINAAVIVPFLLLFSDASLGAAAATTLALALITYIVGDQMLLRMTSNTAAAVADAGIAYLLLWAATAVANWNIDFAELVTVTILYGFVEVMFHRHLRKVNHPNRIF